MLRSLFRGRLKLKKRGMAGLSVIPNGCQSLENRMWTPAARQQHSHTSLHYGGDLSV